LNANFTLPILPCRWINLPAGNYVFYDRQQVNCGACGTDDIAATVLARIVGVYPHNNHFLIDAGALALSKDLAPPHAGYGGVRGHPQLEVVKVTQELGKVSSADGSPVDFSGFAVGSFVEVLPNHNWCHLFPFHYLFPFHFARSPACSARLTPLQPDRRLLPAVRLSWGGRCVRPLHLSLQILVMDDRVALMLYTTLGVVLFGPFTADSYNLIPTCHLQRARHELFVQL
jgi:hypothetical protein